MNKNPPELIKNEVPKVEIPYSPYNPVHWILAISEFLVPIRHLKNQIPSTDKKLICDAIAAGKFKKSLSSDPRFQQTNQTIRCYVMYTDFYRCQKILGTKNDACKWFKHAFTSVCPDEWVEDWDNLRKHDPPLFPWHKRNQGHFPGHNYGQD